MTKAKKALIGQTEKLIKTSAIVYLGLAVISILLIGSHSTSLVWEYSTVDGVATETSMQLGEAEKVLFDFEYRYVLSFVLGFSALLLIILMTNYRKQYAKTVKSRISGFRWVYMGLSSAATLVLVSLLFGINGASSLKVIGLIILLTVGFSWLSERENAGSKKPVWFAFIAALISGFTAWLLVLGAALGTGLFGITSFDWYVYLAGALALFGFAGFAYNQAMTIKQKKQWQTYEFAERNYFAIDLASKSLLGIVLIVGLSAL